MQNQEQIRFYSPRQCDQRPNPSHECNLGSLNTQKIQINIQRYIYKYRNKCNYRHKDITSSVSQIHTNPSHECNFGTLGILNQNKHHSMSTKVTSSIVQINIERYQFHPQCPSPIRRPKAEVAFPWRPESISPSSL